MDVTNLPLLIMNPAAQAEKNLDDALNNPDLEYKDHRHYIGFLGEHTKPNFSALEATHGLGKLLLAVKKWPNASWNHVYTISGFSTRISPSDFYNLTCYAEYARLITDKPPKSYKGTKPGIRLTWLGHALLKQNGLEV